MNLRNFTLVLFLLIHKWVLGQYIAPAAQFTNVNYGEIKTIAISIYGGNSAYNWTLNGATGINITKRSGYLPIRGSETIFAHINGDRNIEQTVTSIFYINFTNRDEFHTSSGSITVTYLPVTCIDNLNITDDVSANKTDNQSAKLKLTATNTINNGGIANYDAGNQVFLKPGFKAKSGAKFKAFIQGCSARAARTLESKTEEMLFSENTLNTEDEIARVENSEVLIYPNPNKGVLYIKEYQNIKEIKISDFFGKVMFRASTVHKELELPKIKEGIYNLQLTTKTNKVSNQKLIVKY